MPLNTPKALAIRSLHAASPRLMTEIRWLRHRRRHLEFQVVDHLVGRGAVVADIGAHHGLYTARMLRVVGGSGHVHAFEPNPANLDVLEGMSCRRLTIHHIALSDTTGSATLHAPDFTHSDSTGMGSLESRETGRQARDRGLPIAVKRLDEVLGEVGGMDFMKVDVEGHEHAVFLGGLSLLRKHQPSLLVEIEQRHRDRPIDETFDLLRELGYEGWAFVGDALRPLGEFDLERDQLSYLDQVVGEHVPRTYAHNFLFTPPGRPLRGIPRRRPPRT